MGRNVFVSYKYADSNVAPLGHNINYYHSTTARDYVDEIAQLLTKEGHKCYAEGPDEDLSYLSDDQIYEKLKNKMFPTSCTIVLISPGMKERYKAERNQWIPWEISYSLRETTRSGYTSRQNAILAVVLPDMNGNYEYALEPKYCCSKTCIKHHTDRLFAILRKNMFNKKNGMREQCNVGDTLWFGECSYIPMIKWCDFKSRITSSIERAEAIKDNAAAYDIHVEISE